MVVFFSELGVGTAGQFTVNDCSSPYSVCPSAATRGDLRRTTEFLCDAEPQSICVRFAQRPTTSAARRAPGPHAKKGSRMVQLVGDTCRQLTQGIEAHWRYTARAGNQASNATRGHGHSGPAATVNNKMIARYPCFTGARDTFYSLVLPETAGTTRCTAVSSTHHARKNAGSPLSLPFYAIRRRLSR